MRIKNLFTVFVLGLGLTLTLLWLLTSGSLPIARAATFTVDITTDENDGSCAAGDCSLRDAIIIANGNGEDDTITLGSGTHVLTITGTGEDAAATGDLDITAPLTITGLGPGQTIIDASGIISDRVFDIRPGAGTVVISGVTIINGNVTGDGGGIYDYNADLTLINTVVSSNTASSNGGGVYVYQGSATLSGGQIISNTADRGGGVHLGQSSATFTQTGVSTITHNTATYNGGGVCVSSGSATLSGGQIRSNTAGWGGGVYVGSVWATLNVSGGQILSNTATYYGGGVYVALGSATLGGGQVLSNTAGWGGGVCVDSGTFTQTGVSTITRNTATYYGGGVYVSSGSATLSGGQILSNTASSGGGGVFVGSGSATLSGGQIRSNTTNNFGGGVYVNTGSATLSGGQILSNTASQYGGGVYVNQSSATFIQTGVSTITHNSASNGGGVCVWSGRAALSGGQTTGNTASNNGGGVYVDTGSATLSGGQIVSNTAQDGGGVYVYQSSATFIQTGVSTITHNTANDGGGVYVRSGSATLSGGQILSNTASSGGGVYVWQGSATLSGGQIVSNTAGNDGGGVFVGAVGAAFTQTGLSAITHNTANDGGGVYVGAGNATLSGGQIRSNTADYGGGIYNFGGTLTLANTTVSRNTASSDGGGVYVYWTTGIFTQTGASAIANNTANWGGGVYVVYGSATLSGGQIISNTATVGGGVYVVYGSATLSGGQIISNTANYGGGVFVWQGSATLNVSGGQILRNSASNYGGGVYVFYGSATLSGGQILSNTASNDGGGIYNGNGTLTLLNTTVSHNTANSEGGGLYHNAGTSVLTYTTVASNTAASGGGGIHTAGGTVLLKNTIVAYNGAANCNAALTSNGYNLEDGNTCGFNAAGDQPNTDPLFGPLADNGGDTLTHALLPGSPAIDAGLCIAGVTSDQRGYPRPNPVSPFCDVGAYESGSTGIADLVITKKVTPTTILPGGLITYTLAFSHTGPAGAAGVVITDIVPVSVTVQSVISSGVVIIDTGVSPGYVWQAQDLLPGEGGVITITGVLSTVLPAGIFTNTATITSTAVDTDVANNSGAAGVTVLNVAPVAADDGYTTTEGTPLTVAAPGVLGNDTDANGDPLTAVKDTGPASGTLTLNANGSFVYTPTAGFVGLDAFTYHANDGTADSNVATVVITVTPVNADLAVSKAVDDPTPNEGDTVVYTLQVTNNGPAQATSVVVSDTLPGGVTYVSDDGGGAYDDATGAWTVGVLNATASATLRITATVDAGTVGTTITNTAAISASDQPDPVPGNDEAHAAITVSGAKVYLPLVLRNY